MRSKEEVAGIFTKIAKMFGYYRDPAKMMAASFKPVDSTSEVDNMSKQQKLPTFKMPKIPKTPAPSKVE